MTMPKGGGYVSDLSGYPLPPTMQSKRYDDVFAMDDHTPETGVPGMVGVGPMVGAADDVYALV
jgi:hypothetical protein|eukprot:COSAG01_NODE_2209_length_8127_cov_2.479420_3_plen_63_part_00